MNKSHDKIISDFSFFVKNIEFKSNIWTTLLEDIYKFLIFVFSQQFWIESN